MFTLIFSKFNELEKHDTVPKETKGKIFNGNQPIELHDRHNVKTWRCLEIYNWSSHPVVLCDTQLLVLPTVAQRRR